MDEETENQKSAVADLAVRHWPSKPRTEGQVSKFNIYMTSSINL